MGEFHNKAERRRWTPERRTRDAERRAALRRNFERYVPNPLAPADTRGLLYEERDVIYYLKQQTWVKLWDALNGLATGAHVGESRPKRQALLALVQRMITEGKIVRHRQSNSIALATWLR